MKVAEVLETRTRDLYSSYELDLDEAYKEGVRYRKAFSRINKIKSIPEFHRKISNALQAENEYDVMYNMLHYSLDLNIRPTDIFTDYFTTKNFDKIVYSFLTGLNSKQNELDD